MKNLGREWVNTHNEHFMPMYILKEFKKKLHLGTTVFGRWTDKFYYSGVVSSYNEKTSKYHISFDDGTKRQMPRQEVVPLSFIHEGVEVLAQRNEVEEGKEMKSTKYFLDCSINFDCNFIGMQTCSYCS